MLDIEYLLLLQRFRIAINDALTPFFEWLSNFAVSYLLLVPVFIYWAIHKKQGYYVLSGYAIVSAAVALIKLCVCAYRPWIRDIRVVPAGDAIRTATGYSFPSGHTVLATNHYGGIGRIEYKKRNWITYLCVFLILLTGFSRNYLGVHTPQDVFVAIVLAVAVLIFTERLLKYLDEHPEKEDMLLLFGILFSAASITFMTFKPYPMDYVDGKLLVDPFRMMNDGYGDTARLTALCMARYIEKRFIKFEATGTKGKGLIVSLIGLIPLALAIAFLRAPLDQMLGTHWGHFTYNFICVFYIIALYPAIIKATCNK